MPPNNMVQNAVTQHPNEERKGNDTERKQAAVGQPQQELARGNDGLSMMLEFGEYPFHGSPLPIHKTDS
jgi:hypothetical protein